MTWVTTTAISAKPRPSVFTRGCFFLLLFGLLSSSTVLAQRRKPVLRLPRRDYFAGKLVLLPFDGRPASFQLPRLVAHLADYEVITPPRSVLGDFNRAADVDSVIAWAKSVDYADVDGVIVSMDLLSGAGPAPSRAANFNLETARQRLELIYWIRAQRPGIPVYGFTTIKQLAPPADGGNETYSQFVTGQVAAGVLDYLLVNQGGAPAGQLSASERERLLAGIAARKVADRILIYPGADAAAMTLVARELNHRFGIAPKVLPIYSSRPGRTATAESEADSLSQSVGVQISAIGGVEVPIAAEAARRADMLLFIHTPQTVEPELLSFAEEVARATAAGYRVAFADVSGTNESKDRMMAELRRRKLLDRLWAYAASSPASDALGAALSQMSARFITARFLRDDPDRLQRAERAQVELLFNRYLDDWAYTIIVRPKLDAFVRDQLHTSPDNLGAAVERAEDFARGQIQPLADELFAEQFKGNLHDILLSTGERVQFVVRYLQLLQFHLSWGRTSEAEIKQGIYIPLSVTMPARQENRSLWEFANPKDLDDRVLARLEATNWPSFDAKADVVEVSLNVSHSGTEAAEDYSIRSRKRSKEARRIEITASSARGAFYALDRLEELGADGKLGQDFQLTEAPSFKQRGIVEGFYGMPWSHRDRLDALRFMGRVRMNRYYYAPKDDPLHRERWRESYGGNELDRFKELLRVAQENFVELVYAISPGLSITYSSEEDFAALRHKLDSLAALGVRHFALFFDDIPETLQKAEDRARFQTLAAAHAYLINRTSEYLRRALPDSSLAVTPTVYTNLYGGRDYLKELGAAIPQEIPIFWTGIDVFAPEYTDAQAREWGELIGRRPIIWDNFPVNDAEPWRVYLGAKRGASPTLSEQVIGFIANPMNQAHASMLPLATSADYAWDARGYNPDQALSRALNLLYDERSRAGLRIWSDVYRDYWWDSSAFKPLFWQQRKEVYVQLMERHLIAMQTALEEIGTARERGLLRGELAPFLAVTRAGIERLKNDPAYERLANGNYRLRSDWDAVAAGRDEPERPQRTIDQAEQVIAGRKQWRGAADASAKVSVNWNSEAIRIRVRVTDDSIVKRAAGKSDPADSVRLLLDTDLAGDYTALRSNEDDFLLGIPVSEGQPAVSITNPVAFRSSTPPRRIDPATVQVAQRVEGDGYEFEIKLLPGIFGRASFEAGFKFGLAVTILDVDAGQNSTKILATSERVDGRNPATWTTVELK